MDDFFSNEDFMPHGHCYLWRPDILWLNVISDATIFLAYMVIPITLFFLLLRRPHIPHKWILLMFSLFITLCGLTHLVEIITVWKPIYAITGILKAATAAVSIATALLFIPLAPKAFALFFDTTKENKNDEKN